MEDEGRQEEEKVSELCEGLSWLKWGKEEEAKDYLKRLRNHRRIVGQLIRETEMDLLLNSQ